MSEIADKEIATDDAAQAALAELTETQRRRFLASLQGESNRAIAAREGVAPQSVDETLNSPTVKRAMRLAGESLEELCVHRKGAEDVPVLKALLDNLAMLALGATRPLVLTRKVGGCSVQEVRNVPDHRVRLDATMKLLGLIEIEEEVEEEAEVVERVRRRVHRRRMTS